VVKQLPHHPKAEGLSQATTSGAGREKIAKIIKIQQIKFKDNQS